METTLYGDLPGDFWDEARGSGEDGDHTGVATADPGDGRPDRQRDAARVEVGDPVGADDVVPLFVSPAVDAGLPLPTDRARHGDEPSAPEGERFEQLQALFPGRIIEVTRRAQVSTGEAAAVGGPGDASTGDYSGSDDYASAASNESADEPRYDTVAEAAAEE